MTNEPVSHPKMNEQGLSSRDTASESSSSGNSDMHDASFDLNEAAETSTANIRKRSAAENSLRPPPKKKKRVSFHMIDIHTHNVTLGDHPSTQGGPPLALDWEKLSSTSIRVDDYEHPTRVRREQTELRMPPEIRQEKLQNEFSRRDMFRAQQECRKIQNQRHHSIAMVDMEGLEIAFQQLGRKYRKWKNRKEPPSPAEQWLKEHKKKNFTRRSSSIELSKNTRKNSLVARRSKSLVADTPEQKESRLRSLTSL